jgi:hypothetical protein
VSGNFALYGLFLYQFADVLHLLTSGATTPLGPDQPVTYEYQSAANLILSVASVSALAVAVAIAFRSVLAGTFAWSLTLATPLWLGMSHVDFKDMPVAAGMTLVTAGLVLSFAIEPARKASIVGCLLAGAGGAITLATRPGSLVLLAVLAGATAVTALGWGVARRRLFTVMPVQITAASALVCAFVFTWATNPIARIDMSRWLLDAYALVSKYPWDGFIRVAGVDVHSIELPWWYVPAWLLAQLPLLSLVAVVGGFTGLMVGLAHQRGRVSAETAIPLVPIMLQGIVLPAVIVLTGAVLYDGIRQLLFLVPGLIAVSAVALALLDRRVRNHRARLSVVLSVSAVVIVAASLWASLRWAPYAYAYINPIAGRNEDGRSWELDYWGVSGREGVRRLKQLGYSPVYLQPSPTVGLPWAASSGDPRPGDHAGLYVFLRSVRAADFGCTVLFTIKRDGHVLGEGARCPRATQG